VFSRNLHLGGNHHRFFIKLEWLSFPLSVKIRKSRLGSSSRLRERIAFVRLMAASNARAVVTSLTTADQFLDCIRKSQLVEEARLAGFLEAIGANEGGTLSPEQLADRLIADGLLTHFQARQLLRSRWQGFLLGGKYRILELLGSGGMGRVFLCEHARLGIPIAVKVLPPEKMDDEAVLARFHREARAAATLSHPNLVRAFDIDDDGDFSFIVMEYVHGHSLQRLVEDRGAFSVSRAVSCIRQAARGLQHFCEQGLVHRDIKPGNILLDRQGTIKVLDMGLARFFRDTQDRLTQEHMRGSVLGTADYLAPEQALDSHQVTIQADVYSLGATFYFLLAGRAPFEEGTITQKMLWHQVRQPPPLRTWRDDVPAELEAILLRMMAKEPAQRFASPAEVVEALGPWDQPCPPLREEDLPPLCPAVQRLLNRTPPPASCCPPRLPASSCASLSPGEGILTEPLDSNASSVLESVSVTPVTPLPDPAGTLAPPARSFWRRYRLWTAAALLVPFLAWGGYRSYVRFFPPAPGPARSPHLKGFDPLAGINPGSMIPDYLAVGQVGQTRTVRLTVRDRERNEAGTIFLYSGLARNDTKAKVFTIAIPSAARAAFKRAGIADPYVFFMGQTIDVKGPVKYLTEGFNRPGIEAMEPGQIQFVNPE
jgi:serine/threonine protein kinase